MITPQDPISKLPVDLIASLAALALEEAFGVLDEAIQNTAIGKQKGNLKP
jgi:hypothetical protein